MAYSRSTPDPKQIQIPDSRFIKILRRFWNRNRTLKKMFRKKISLVSNLKRNWPQILRNRQTLDSFHGGLCVSIFKKCLSLNWSLIFQFKRSHLPKILTPISLSLNWSKICLQDIFYNGAWYVWLIVEFDADCVPLSLGLLTFPWSNVVVFNQSSW